MSIFRHIVGIAAELLLQKDPYQEYTPPRVVSETKDACGRVVSQRVRAVSASEASEHLRGTTAQGNRSRVVTHRTDIRRGVYDIHVEDWRDE